MKTLRHEAIPALLVLLSLVPLAAGLVRLGQVAAGGPVTPGNSRFLAVPLPVVLHIVTATVYALVGAFQFSPALRRRHPGIHRGLGRLVGLCGLVVALSGLWMTLFYPIPADHQGPLLWAARLAVGLGMTGALVLGVAAILKRDVGAHEAWMMRAYGLALGAGTQVLTALPWMILVGDPTGLVRDLLLVAGWAINLAVVELVLFRRTLGRRTPVSASI